MLRAPNERRLPLVLASLAAAGSAVWVAVEVLGLRGLPAPWPLVLAVGALLSAVVAGRVARAVEPVTMPTRRRAWPVVRGFLAAIGALTVLTASTLVGLSLMGPTLRNLFGASTTCLSGEPATPPTTRSAGHLKVYGYRTLKPFAEVRRTPGTF